MSGGKRVAPPPPPPRTRALKCTKSCVAPSSRTARSRSPSRSRPYSASSMPPSIGTITDAPSSSPRVLRTGKATSNVCSRSSSAARGAQTGSPPTPAPVRVPQDSLPRADDVAWHRRRDALHHVGQSGRINDDDTAGVVLPRRRRRRRHSSACSSSSTLARCTRRCRSRVDDQAPVVEQRQRLRNGLRVACPEPARGHRLHLHLRHRLEQVLRSLLCTRGGLRRLRQPELQPAAARGQRHHHAWQLQRLLAQLAQQRPHLGRALLLLLLRLLRRRTAGSCLGRLCGACPRRPGPLAFRPGACRRGRPARPARCSARRAARP